jgi:beta-ureidopropionase / N-carbamoyl-L-amino-acid hydrolase
MVMLMPETRINSVYLHDLFEELSDIGATRQGGVHRLALSNEDLEARSWFAEQIEMLGFALRDDDVGNLSGVLRCSNMNAKTLLIGSHLDSAPNGGRYDGAIGILAGLECLRVIKERGLDLPFHLEVIDFTDEEGSWQSLYGSMGLTGTLTEAHISDSKTDNAPFRAALNRAGINPYDYLNARRDPNSLLGYLELHIEQSDFLEQNNLNIGVVSRVVGRSSFKIRFIGEAVHAATNYAKKRDALLGAACFITDVHSLAQEFAGGMVNCGSIDIQPNRVTIVPSYAKVKMEVRHPDPATLAQMEEKVAEIAKQCALHHQLEVRVERTLHRDVVYMNDTLMQSVESVCDELNLSHTRMVSLAGHDAQILAPFTPSALIFIPCKDGISMNPKEYTDWSNVENGANVLLKTILRIAEQF